MHLDIVKEQIAYDGQTAHLPAEHMLEFPRQQNAVGVQRAVNRQTSDIDAGGHHAHQVQRRGNDAHVAGNLDHAIPGFRNSLAAEQRQDRRHGIHQHAQRIRAVIAAAPPVADHVAVLRIRQHRIQRIGEHTAGRHDDHRAQNDKNGLPVPRSALYDKDDGNHHQS